MFFLVSRNREGNTKEKDLSSSEELGKKGREKLSLQKKEGKSSINRDVLKKHIKNGKADVPSKKIKAEEVFLESSSDKDDGIDGGQNQKNSKITVEEECNKDTINVKENKEDNAESIVINEEGSLKEGTGTKFKGLGSSSDDEDISVVEVKNEQSNDDTKEGINKPKVCTFILKSKVKCNK